MDIFLTNSLTKKIEKFEPINPPQVGIYTCGPTVYDYATIGNFRTYLTGDLVCRVLKFNGYEVKYVMNLTDVGHLTGDNLGDSSQGEDRLEKAAKRESKTAWDISSFYAEAFIRDMEKMNLMKPHVLPKATDHIPEQVALIQELEKKGFTYKTSDGIYFDTENFEKTTGKKYGELSNMDSILEGARIEPNPEKRNPRDFALWKFSDKPGTRHMEWESPWGLGFPGWHIECSAMSMKYLGETFDIHVGGEDLRQTHHPNEIAQSEGATGKQFVKYWIHQTFLQVDGKRMGKSLGNAYTVTDIEEKGFDPLSLRYLFLTAHYRDTLNFTWEALEGAENALNKLRQITNSLRGEKSRTVLSQEKEDKRLNFMNSYLKALADDFNTPQALAVVWEVAKSNIPSPDKYDLITSFDEVLGLNLAKAPEAYIIPQDVTDLANARQEARIRGDFAESDRLRDQILKNGFNIRDTSQGYELAPIKTKLS